MQTLDYSSWSLGVKQRVGGRRVPLSGTIELTRRCNNRCRHCYNNLPASDLHAHAEELRTDELIRILDEAAAAGCVWLLLTGGEIFLRPDFREIYTHAKQNGLLVTLFTNGTLITPELADFLANQRPFSIEITLYGATRETYERVTGNPGSFGQCLRGIGHLRDRGLPLKLKATLSTLNRHEIEAMKRLAENDLGLPFRFDALLNARCDRSPGPLDVRLSPEEVVQLDLADPERAEALRDFARRRPGHGAGDKKGSPLYPCGGGAHSFAIDPYGRLRACAISPGEGFDLQEWKFSRRMGPVFGAAARAQNRPRHEVSDVHPAGGVRDVSGQRRTRMRGLAAAGRFPLPRGAPARLCARHSNGSARGLRILPRRPITRRNDSGGGEL